MLLQSLPYDILSLFIIDILLINKDHMQIFFCSLHLSINCIIKKIPFIIDLSGIKSNWFLVTLVTPLKRYSMIISHRFIVWLISLIH
jgi:hypothetical protein